MRRPGEIGKHLDALERGTVSVVQVVEEALVRADNAQEQLNAFAALDHLGARRRAGDLESIAVAKRGPLHGVPLTIKDLFNVDGLPTLAGTRAKLPPFGSHESTLVTRMRAAGAVVLGKTNMHEVAFGLTGENPWTGPVRNPHDPTRMAGGSSSGAAAALAAGVGLGALGTDTAGSIRLPASFCGVVGFKPTFGALPLDGALPLTPSLDHAGPMAHSVDDIRVIFRVLLGGAGTSLLYKPGLGSRRPSLAVPTTFLAQRLSDAVEAEFNLFLRRAAAAGARICEVDLPRLGHASDLQTSVGWPEAYLIHREALAANPESFSPQVRASLDEGARITAAEYLQAMAARKRLTSELSDCFERTGADALVLPAAPFPAPTLGTAEVQLVSGIVPFRAAVLPLLAPFSLAGLPTVSQPMAFISGLPANVQTVARRGADAMALDVAAWLEMLELK